MYITIKKIPRIKYAKAKVKDLILIRLSTKNTFSNFLVITVATGAVESASIVKVPDDQVEEEEIVAEDVQEVDVREMRSGWLELAFCLNKVVADSFKILLGELSELV